MAIRFPTKSLRRAFYNNSINSFKRSIAISTVKMEKVLENLQSNPYYEKYSSRISELQKTSPEKFKTIVRKQTEGEIKSSILAPVDTSKFSSVLNPKSSQRDVTSTAEKKLGDIFKEELVKDKDGEEIKIIWEEYHKLKEVISATIPMQLYSDLMRNMKKHPLFLFPLPRDQGYEFMLSQCHGHAVHFTPLLAYQVHKENSPECLTMVHYTELSDKGIVLMRGDYDKNVLTGQEAQCLANQFQMYYNGKEKTKLTLLETFTNNPATFKHMDLIEHLENIQLVV